MESKARNEFTIKTSDNSLISILMPTYNVKNYVYEAVQSVIRQTYSNFELIIVDDCSTDGTYEILQNLAKEDYRIKLYRNSSNLKICKTLNKALSKAKGLYIGRMDGDDISEANRFELLKKYLDENPLIMLVGSSLISIDETGKKIGDKKYPILPKSIKTVNCFGSSVPHFWLARREIYDSLKGYREIPYAEDYDFLLRGENKGYKYANISECVYSCRIRKGNTVSSNGVQQKKAVEYVKKLNRLERRKKIDMFSEEEYQKAISSTEKEVLSYSTAAQYLNNAIHNKSNKIVMISNICRAFCADQYMRKYLFFAAEFRIVKEIENSLLLIKKKLACQKSV